MTVGRQSPLMNCSRPFLSEGNAVPVQTVMEQFGKLCDTPVEVGEDGGLETSAHLRKKLIRRSSVPMRGCHCQ